MTARISLLVTDDSPEILFATARLLRSAGYAVDEADTGEACLRNVREKAPDLVLLDVELPDADGREICRRIKTDAGRPGTFVLMISGGKTASDDRSEGLEIGADGYIVRPVTNRELLARIQAMERIITAERERDALIEKLQKALDEVKTLQTLLPICAHCKSIRNDQGYWEQIEEYMMKHSNILFSHGLCPACLKELYGDLADEIAP